MVLVGFVWDKTLWIRLCWSCYILSLQDSFFFSLSKIDLIVFFPSFLCIFLKKIKAYRFV